MVTSLAFSQHTQLDIMNHSKRSESNKITSGFKNYRSYICWSGFIISRCPSCRHIRWKRCDPQMKQNTYFMSLMSTRMSKNHNWQLESDLSKKHNIRSLLDMRFFKKIIGKSCIQLISNWAYCIVEEIFRKNENFILKLRSNHLIKFF